MDFLPICKQDMIDRGISQFDFVYVIGDAYVDHPSFGHAIISRILESHGYSVGIISQPDWKGEVAAASAAPPAALEASPAAVGKSFVEATLTGQSTPLRARTRSKSIWKRKSAFPSMGRPSSST